MLADTEGALAVTYAARRVLVLGDTPAARLIATDAVERAGGGVVASFEIAGDADAMLDGRDAALVMVEVDRPMADTGAFEALLSRLDRDAGHGRPSIVTVPRAMLDLAAARAGHRNVSILCEPQPVDRVAALGVALAATGARLNDVNADPGSQRLRQLSEEVGRIARTLATLSSQNDGRQALRGSPLLEGMLPGVPTPDAEAIEPAAVRAIIRARRLRNQYFDTELFADPAWDILLDLTAARLERTPVAVSSLCIAAAVPPTTALRWIKTLTDMGLLLRAADARDGRRVFIELSDAAAAGMIAYLTAAARLGTILA